MKFSDLNVGTRLTVGFGFVLCLMAFLVVLGITRLESVDNSTSQMVDKDWVKADAANLISAYTRANARRSMELLIAPDKAYRTHVQERIEANKKSVNDALVTLDSLVALPEGRALLAKIKEQRAAFVSSFTLVAKLVEEDKHDEAKKTMLEQALPALDTLQKSINELVSLQKKVVETSGSEIKQSVDFAQMLMVAVGLGALVAGIAFAWMLTSSITGPLRRAVTVAKTVASGDLTSRIEVRSKDETGVLLQALKDMNESLVRIVSQVRTGTETIAGASSQIAAGNLDLSSRTEEQASSLEETASSMEELTSTVKQNADNARQANTLVLSASDVASRGGAVVAEVVQTMGSINESARKIVDIIGVIDGIAFQTNILALNAAVEAARAGEQGRGFAVVAAEVRTLAQRSAQAAKEIKELIGDSVEKVENGTRLVDQAGATMAEIVDSVKRVTDIMSEISAASQEQTAGIEQINQAISQMDEVTQQNASLVEEAAAASEAMQEQAGNLQQVVSTFRIDAAHVAAVVPIQKVRQAQSAKKPVASKREAVAAPRTRQLATANAAADGWEEF
ncbi:MAG TPA: methyl-accepting chemotaxis protein [Noviherbaspirillum sp.]|nr:methyl-accepting chemotaxis protein [Noviherbaspirillum sp.]